MASFRMPPRGNKCLAKTKSGKQCKAPAMKGTTRCYFHMQRAVKATKAYRRRRRK